MITLFTIGQGFGLPEISPYVTKTEVQLRMAGLDYCKVQGSREQAPKGQLPWIEDDGEVVGDSHFIRLHLERKYGVDFDAGLTGAERGQAWAVERMVENHLGWNMVNLRWLDPANFERGPAGFFEGLPDSLRDEVVAQVLAEVAANVRAAGLGRHSPDEILGLGVRSLQALSAMIGTRPYLMGERPCGTDATIFAMLAAMLTPHFDGPLRRAVLRFDNLTAYADRMMAAYYPEFAWAPGEPLAA